MQECGLAGFGDWDDDATRRFIRDADCATIDSLTLSEMLNLFEGDTGDADDRQVLRATTVQRKWSLTLVQFSLRPTRGPCCSIFEGFNIRGEMRLVVWRGRC
jgi:hypothetical protein